MEPVPNEPEGKRDDAKRRQVPEGESAGKTRDAAEPAAGALPSAEALTGEPSGSAGEQLPAAELPSASIPEQSGVEPAASSAGGLPPPAGAEASEPGESAEREPATTFDPDRDFLIVDERVLAALPPVGSEVWLEEPAEPDDAPLAAEEEALPVVEPEVEGRAPKMGLPEGQQPRVGEGLEERAPGRGDRGAEAVETTESPEDERGLTIVAVEPPAREPEPVEGAEAGFRTETEVPPPRAGGGGRGGREPPRTDQGDGDFDDDEPPADGDGGSNGNGAGGPMRFDKPASPLKAELEHAAGLATLAAPFLALMATGLFGGSKLADIIRDARAELNRPVAAATLEPAAIPAPEPTVTHSPVFQPELKATPGWNEADVISPARFACDLEARGADGPVPLIIRFPYSVTDKAAFIEALNQAYATGKVTVGTGESAQQAFGRELKRGVDRLHGAVDVNREDVLAQLQTVVNTLGLSKVVSLPKLPTLSVQAADAGVGEKLWKFLTTRAELGWGAAVGLLGAALASALWAAKTVRSSFFTVKAPNIVPVYRFGRLVRTPGAGWHVKWPTPVERVDEPRTMAVVEHALPMTKSQLGDGTDYHYRAVLQLQIIPGKEREAILGLANPTEQIKKWTDAFLERKFRGLKLDDMDNEQIIIDLADKAAEFLSGTLERFGYRVAALNLQDLRPEERVLAARQDAISKLFKARGDVAEAVGTGDARVALFERYGQALKLVHEAGVPEQFIQEFMLRDREADAIEAAAREGGVVVAGMGGRTTSGQPGAGMSQEDLVSAIVAAFRATQREQGGGNPPGGGQGGPRRGRGPRGGPRPQQE